MKSNFWEEMNNKDNISAYHETTLKNVDIPAWANIACPFCDRSLPLRSVRSIGLKLNTRNLGDVFVEVLCEDCAIMDTVYFRGSSKTMQDFVQLLDGSKEPQVEPVIEEEMYKMQYNNLLEQMTGENMTLVKRAVCSSNVVVSSSVYTCPSCGHTDIVSGDARPNKDCPKCGTCMDMIQSQAGSESDLVIPSTDEEVEE